MKGTASEATYVCLLAARSRMLATLKEEHPEADKHSFMSKLVMYCSDQVRYTAWYIYLVLKRCTLEVISRFSFSNMIIFLSHS